ncbi:MAG TPA: selenide, water dikinase SelD [Pseudomonas xinjiangensis]|uniref:Selenide, water dikinase n=2 Tax=root TaxID=1 RepID=A0A7V1FSP9_9GAMM|nr:selenide, water dikinase SelD [Halopseudomonas xinjiangensis]HEC49409.1 selenide, water dikinase SelD [Halopseudomonas xinjiangensis]
MTDKVRLTEYSHGAGCGCKISPQVLDEILAVGQPGPSFPQLWVGNDSRDDAAVFGLDDEQGIVSTTDFFMPIVDDPFDFGRIAATNAISDIYAMGGTPLMAIAILGWPVNLLPAAVAGEVIAGARSVCIEAGMPLAGGHSIDAPEPIFGLAVTGRVMRRELKRNDTARPGAKLFLTKPLGIGILTTAEKQKKLLPEHVGVARDLMCQLNRIGAQFATLKGVQAMTDVTGFGLLGHLVEMAEGSGIKARIEYAQVPCLASVEHYLAQGCVPGGTGRNFASYGHKLADLPAAWRDLLCDPQTSGGLLVAVEASAEEAFLAMARHEELDLTPIGECLEADGGACVEVV